MTCIKRTHVAASEWQTVKASSLGVQSSINQTISLQSVSNLTPLHGHILPPHQRDPLSSEVDSLLDLVEIGYSLIDRHLISTL